MSALQQWAQGIDLQWVITQATVILAAVISLTVHECSHALAAKLLGDDTAQRLGRLSLNPLRHLSVSGLLMLAIVHFGWAKPVPVDMRRFKNPKTGMALTSLAGPGSNVLLALVSCLVLQCFFAFDKNSISALIAGEGARFYFFYFFYILATLNAGLAVFNLIPISPLDGSKILAIVLPDKAYLWLMRYERYGMFLLMLLLFTGVLDVPLDFLRTGLLRGLSLLTHLPFPDPNILRQIF